MDHIDCKLNEEHISGLEVVDELNVDQTEMLIQDIFWVSLT